MKLGCIGCLTSVVLVAALCGAIWAGIQVLREPDLPVVASTPEEGVRAQQRIFEIVRRGRHRGERAAETIVLSEREVNAFFSRHLAEIPDLPVTDLGLRLPGGGRAEFRARLPLRSLFGEPPLSGLAGALPAALLDRRVWLRVGTRPRLDVGAARRESRYLRFEVMDFAVGRQRLPAVLLRVLLDPAMLRVLRWPVPDGVDTVTVEAGRVLVRLAS